MKKSNLLCGAAYALLGLVFLLAGLLWETRLSSLCVGFGAGMLSSGVVQLARYRKWTRPQNAAVYRQRLEEEQIDLRDERKEMLRNKSGRYAYILGLLAAAAAMTVFSFLGKLGMVDEAACRLMILFLAGYMVFQIVAGWALYRLLDKKY